MNLGSLFRQQKFHIPVLLHFHGGAFAIGDKGDIQVTPFLRGIIHDYVVVSVNYRLSGEAIFPAGL